MNRYSEHTSQKNGTNIDILGEIISSKQLWELWEYSEALIASELEVRKFGFEHLVENNIVDQSALLIYLFASRIKEPDIKLRAYIINVLGSAVTRITSRGEISAPPYQTLSAYLSHAGKDEIKSILELLEADPSSEENIVKILGTCSCAGQHLSEILSDRNESLTTRLWAVILVGKVGYLESIPNLVRLHRKLSTRVNNKFSGDEYAQFIQQIEEALILLRAP